MTLAAKGLDRLAIDTIRTLSIDAVQKANSGHPGAPMGAAPMAYVLWTRFLRHAPTDPGWPNRDRFVLSAEFNRPGHAVVDHRIYGICSDGDLQEGVASESASLAGHLHLGKLIFLYDDNHIQLDGPTDWAMSEDVP